MVKCVDCANFQKEKCVILKAGLTFPPNSEVVCPEFKEKKQVVS